MLQFHKDILNSAEILHLPIKYTFKEQKIDFPSGGQGHLGLKVHDLGTYISLTMFVNIMRFCNFRGILILLLFYKCGFIYRHNRIYLYKY